LEVLLLLLFLAIAFVVAVTLAQRSEPLQPGAKAPTIDLPDQTGASFGTGMPTPFLVLVFLPRDETSRCLAEVSEFESLRAQFEQIGASIAFVSIHDVPSQAAFHRAHAMTLPLLADLRGSASRAFGTVIDFFVYRFAKRTTFLCHSGTIKKTYVVVEPRGHAEAVLSDLTAMSTTSSR
jgi:thioredoxin-dependent peroxiredoxin